MPKLSIRASLCLSIVLSQASHSRAEWQATSKDPHVQEAVGHSEHIEGEAFQQFKVFLEFQQEKADFEEWRQHRSEFLSWRESKTREVSQFMTWLLPHGHKNIQEHLAHHSEQGIAVSSDSLRKEFQEYTTWPQKLRNFWARLKMSPPFQNIVTVVKRHLDYAFWVVCDVFFALLLLLIMIAYFYNGLWGIVLIPWHCLELLVVCCSYLILGPKLVESPSQFKERDIVSCDYGSIADNGIAKPAKTMFRKKFEDLTPGQRYVLGKVGLNGESWDFYQAECVKSHRNIPPPPKSWSDFEAYHRKWLDSIGFTKQAWNHTCPEDLPIEQKEWFDLSNYEKREAIAAGVNVERDGVEAWDERKAEIFRSEYKELSDEVKLHFRHINFFPDQWVCEREPQVPTDDEEKESWLEICFDFISQKLLFFFITLQLVFLLWILYELNILNTVYDKFLIYVVEILLFGAFLVSLAHCFIPQVTTWHKSLKIKSSVMLCHIKDLWNLVSKSCVNNCRACGKNCSAACNHCNNGTCWCGGSSL